MTDAERQLLLAIARILRAKIQDEVYAERDGDLWAINEALAPFEPKMSQGPAGDHDQVGWMGGEFDR